MTRGRSFDWRRVGPAKLDSRAPDLRADEGRAYDDRFHLSAASAPLQATTT
jgi:hypothetical protein